MDGWGFDTDLLTILLYSLLLLPLLLLLSFSSSHVSDSFISFLPFFFRAFIPSGTVCVLDSAGIVEEGTWSEVIDKWLEMG